MKVFAYHANVEDYNWFDTFDHDDILFDEKIRGESLSATWQEIPIVPIPEEDKFALSDFVTIGTGYTPIFSAKAVQKLDTQLSGKGEFLKMPSLDMDYYVFNVTHFIDALEESKSILVTYSGSIARITHYHFNESAIPNETLVFKIPQLPVQRVFVTEKFLELVAKNDLQGLDCKLVWDDGPLPINPNDIVTVI